MKVTSAPEGKAYYRVMGSLGSSLRRIVANRLPVLRENISVDMFASNYLPYEASRTYRTIMIELDSKRAQALMETQRQLLRGI
jgi:hypothetical protein